MKYAPLIAILLVFLNRNFFILIAIISMCKLSLSLSGFYSRTILNKKNSRTDYLNLVLRSISVLLVLLFVFFPKDIIFNILLSTSVFDVIFITNTIDYMVIDENKIESENKLISLFFIIYFICLGTTQTLHLKISIINLSVLVGCIFIYNFMYLTKFSRMYNLKENVLNFVLININIFILVILDIILKFYKIKELILFGYCIMIFTSIFIVHFLHYYAFRFQISKEKIK